MNDIIVKSTGNRPVYPPLPAGSYAAVCYAIACLGTTFNPAFGNEQTKVLFMWEIPDETIEIDGELKPRAISETYTLSLHEKASLRKMLESWRGRAFTEEELQGFGLSAVLGKSCLLSTITKTKQNGYDYAKIIRGIPPPKGNASPS